MNHDFVKIDRNWLKLQIAAVRIEMEELQEQDGTPLEALVLVGKLASLNEKLQALQMVERHAHDVALSNEEGWFEWIFSKAKT